MAKLILYQAKSPYPGDVTKNCALTGKEVDNNFLNLKGEDIEKIYLDEETKKLTFTRFKDGLKNCNGEPIKAEIEVDLTALEYVTGYKYEDGVIVVTYSNGKTEQMPIEAFGMAVATDSTISGNGSRSKPLSISQAMRTGQYQPVKGFIDMVEGEKLPKEHLVNGDGYVTRELKSDFGMFYTSDQALKLQELLMLDGSEWRVPTKKDWDTLLNYLEDCDKYKNHSLRSQDDRDARGMKLGNLAGFKAKSKNTPEADYWPCGESNGDVLRIYPSGSFSALSGAYSGFGNHAHFWSLTEGDVSCRNFYSKKFIDCIGTVTQIEEMPAAKLTIRLVKDFLGDNYNKFEDIHGRLYETKLFASEGEECNQVWTMVNVDISDAEHDLIPTPMPESAMSAITSDYAYYVYRWDGRKWDKHEMVEGDCIVLVSEEKAYDDRNRVDEYRLERDLDGKLQLINMDEFWQEQIDYLASGSSGSTGYLLELIEDLSGVTMGIKDTIDGISATTAEVKEIVGNGLSGETITDAILGIREDLADEISARAEADEILQENIDAEASARTTSDEILQENIDNEETERIEEDEKLWAALNATASTLEDAVAEEARLREDADNILQQEIDEEAEMREIEDTKIKRSIGQPSDIPEKSAVEYSDEDFEDGNITVFGFINASNDYGYNLED